MSLLLSHSETGDASKPRKDEEAAHEEIDTDLLGTEGQQHIDRITGKYSTCAPYSAAESSGTHRHCITIAK